MSTVSKPAKRRYYATIKPITTGVLKGLFFTENRSGSRCFVFKKGVEGKRNHPVFAITDSKHIVLKWVGPNADEARAKYAS